MNMNAIRIALTSVIWAGAFKISGSHIVDVAMKNGNRFDDAIIYPLSIDALIIACALWVSAPKGVNKATRLWAAAGRYFGFAATLYANLAHSGWSSIESGIINLIPAIAVIIATEVFVHGMKSTPAAKAAAKAKASSPAKLKVVA
jgi:drug/metabolite transporter (DMT)-like permease